MQSRNQFIQLPILEEKGIVLAIKREDLLHPLISGNKYRKLKYNLVFARELGYKTLLTYGGAFSNHILAVAAAGKENGLKTIGIIRGDELAEQWNQNPTLQLASQLGMCFKFVSRESYRSKETGIFTKDLEKEFGDFYVIPEGGTNALAIKGCEEMLTDRDRAFDVIATSVGTGGTLAGLVNSAEQDQQVLGFSALKGDFLNQEIGNLTVKLGWKLITDYHFGGYGKVNEKLITFINNFRSETGIPLDPIYTGKMLFGLLDRIKNDSFAKGTKILAIHTGGLQGISGMNTVLKKKKLPLLDI